MSDLVKELQHNLFGGLHDFHTERTETWIEAVREKFGNEVLEALQEKGVDTYGLISLASGEDAFMDRYAAKCIWFRCC